MKKLLLISATLLMMGCEKEEMYYSCYANIKNSTSILFESGTVQFSNGEFERIDVEAINYEGYRFNLRTNIVTIKLNDYDGNIARYDGMLECGSVVVFDTTGFKVW